MTSHMAVSRYSAGAILLHWVIGVLILVNLALGLGHDAFDDAGVKGVMDVHKSIGLAVLALSFVRIGWRLTHSAPPLPAAMPGWQVLVAKATHIFFYVAMIALPLTGWLMSSASPLRFPLEFFGLFSIPYLPVPQSRDAVGGWGDAHEILGITMLAVVVLHIAGALKHHLVDKDDVLRRMLPRG